MGKILFANVGWMMRYEGNGTSDFIIGGGSWNAKDKHEVFNFQNLNGYCCGYVEPAKNAHGISIERISPEGIGKESLKDVLVVWTAARPKRGGTVIVGWYNHATVYRYFQTSKSTKRNEYNYYVKAKKEDCVLLNVDDRTHEIPRSIDGVKKGLMGQSNVWYADTDSLMVRNIRKETIKYIEQKLAGKIQEGKVYHPNIEIKKKVEEAAVNAVTRYYEEKGYNIVSVEKENRGWDLTAKSGKIELYIEVKGIRDSYVSVMLTPNELKTMEGKNRDVYRLCVVTDALYKPNIWTFIYNGREWVSDDEAHITLHFYKKVAAVAYIE